VLNLKKIYYTDTTNYCHFIGDYNWENIIIL
jgi:hypothetical protein